MLRIIFMILLGRIHVIFSLASNFKYSEELGTEFILKWNIDKEYITMQVTAPSTGWVSVGFSPDGGFPGSDSFIGGVNSEGNYIEDVHAPSAGGPRLDESQHFEILSAEENATSTTVVVRRKLSTEDERDIAIKRGKTFVLWAYGPSDVWRRGETGSLPTQTGSKEVELIPDIDEVNFIHQETLSEEKNVFLSWYYTDNDITFKVTFPTTGWIALGLSPDGEFAESDAFIAGVKENQEYIQDVYGPKEGGPPKLDDSQDVELLEGVEDESSTTIIARRKLITGDEHDIDIKTGRRIVTWAYGNIDQWKGAPSSASIVTGTKEVVLIPEENTE